ncbi:MAG: phosphoribosylformylglycinamidine synthase subunit PurS [Rhizobiaceae bacterium]
MASQQEFSATVMVRLKNGVLDPQGKAIEGALDSLGFEGVKQVQQGKTFHVALEASSKKNAQEIVEAMCEKLLANTVIEDYTVEVG